MPSYTRKVFVKTDLTIPQVKHEIRDGLAVIPLEEIPPAVTRVMLDRRGISKKSFDFAPWYGLGIDQVTYACQRQIERFLAKQDAEVSPMTIVTYCSHGMRPFLDYLAVRSSALRRELTLQDINREVIDGYIGSFDDSKHSIRTKKIFFTNAKSVLLALCERGLITQVHGGDDATFPANPFPGSHHGGRGARPLSKAERKAFAAAVKEAVLPIFDDDVEPTSHLLAYALLIIALHTGRNTTPLLEMTNDCLRPHPKADTLFLVLFKRRNHSANKVAIRDAGTDSPQLEATPTVRPTVARLVRRVIQLAGRLQGDAHPELQQRVWLFRRRTRGRGESSVNDISVLSPSTLAKSIALLVKQYDLRDRDGKPLQINISRLRKTFVNRIYEILDGDIVATAAAAGNTVNVTSVNYLRPSEDAEKNWHFLGMALTQELLTNTLGATERTPVGRCSDVQNGDYAPKKEKVICTSFLNCVRCRNYVVTADDLYRLFSFYWRILSERARMDARRWQKQLAHIVRLIDRDVVEKGVSRGIFKQAVVDRQRERARLDPHPFWRSESVIAEYSELGGM